MTLITDTLFRLVDSKIINIYYNTTEPAVGLMMRIGTASPNNTLFAKVLARLLSFSGIYHVES